MFTRKIDHTGRITLPAELLDKFYLKKNDVVEVSHNETHITIKKFQPEFACAITGKITSEGEMIGNAFISYEGMKIIVNKLKKDGMQ